MKDFIQEQSIELKSTHQKLCYPIIVRIYKKMKLGIRFSGIKVDGDLIIDGHHRYLAALVAGISLDIYPSSKTSATTEVSWNEVDFDQNEWDTEAKILMLNTIDAEYNDLSIDDLNELLK